MRRFLHRSILLPGFESGLKRRKVFRYWHDLERSQWFSTTDLQHLQLKALRRLLTHTFETCPYYHDAWTERGIGLADIRSLSADDFVHRWPVIDRDTVRNHRGRMRTGAPGIRLMAKSTGGSTGVPLHFDLDSESLDRRMAAWHRGYAWAGAEPGSKQFYFWGVPLGERLWYQRAKDYVYNWLYRRDLVNVFDFCEARIPDILHRLNRYRPDVIVAYTNPLDLLARSLEARGLKPVSPHSIVVGAEKLHPFQRKRIGRVFNAPVFETYGSREFMLIGAECDRHLGLHLTMENLFVEVVDDDGHPTPAGEEGNIAVTDLYNFGMPFVRYLNGDRGIAGWETCPCGRGLPLLRQVAGRRLDVLFTPDGRRVPGEFFPHLIKDFSTIYSFQVVQEELDCVQLRVVLHGPWTDADHARLTCEVGRILGPTTRFAFIPVDDIPLTASGKHRVVVNLLPNVALHANCEHTD